jgi:hypothetical protein
MKGERALQKRKLRPIYLIQNKYTSPIRLTQKEYINLSYSYSSIAKVLLLNGKYNVYIGFLSKKE